MQIAEGIETGRDYYWRRSEGWTGLQGQPDRHWEYYVEFSGFNGAGGVWCIEKMRHNRCSSYPNGTEWFSTQPMTLSHEKSMELVRTIQQGLGIQLPAEAHAGDSDA